MAENILTMRTTIVKQIVMILHKCSGSSIYVFHSLLTYTYIWAFRFKVNQLILVTMIMSNCFTNLIA